MTQKRSRLPDTTFFRYRKSRSRRTTGMLGRKSETRFGTAKNYRCRQIRIKKRRSSGAQISVLEIFSDANLVELRQQHELLHQV